MINGKKIKVLYNCTKLTEDDPLVDWYNHVIEKNISELTVSDVARCIRQNLFLELAYEMVLVYLLQNPYEGDMYGGELMDKACEIEREFIKKHKEIIIEIVDKAKVFINTYDWQCEEDKDEFAESVEFLAEMV